MKRSKFLAIVALAGLSTGVVATLAAQQGPTSESRCVPQKGQTVFPRRARLICWAPGDACAFSVPRMSGN